MSLLSFATALPAALLPLPFALVAYLLSPRFRPDRVWTFRQAAGVRVFGAVVHLFSLLQIPTPLSFEAGKEGSRWVVVRWKDEWKTFFKGPMLVDTSQDKEDGNILPGTDVGGTWYSNPPTSSFSAPTPDNNNNNNTNTNNNPPLTILHLHGGAFVIGDGRTPATGFLARTLLAAFPPSTRLFAPQYRLSSLPPSPTSHPFPAALQDTLTSYLHLTHDLRIPPSRIILSGDSAGGNLAIALLRYIAAFGAPLGLDAPAAALLWSPWVNPASGDPGPLLNNPNFGSDILSVPFLSWGHKAYTHTYTSASSSSGTSEKVDKTESPYINAALEPFHTSAHVWVSVGGREVLCADGAAWVEGMRSVKGNRVEIDVEEAAPHDVLLLGREVGFVGEAREMAGRAGRWWAEGGDVV